MVLATHERLVDGSELHNEADSLKLDASKVGTSTKGEFQRILLSLAIGDALQFGKYIRQVGGEGGGGGGGGGGGTVSAMAGSCTLASYPVHC